VELPDGQDVNDFFKLYDLAEFRRVVKLARPFDVAGVMDIYRGLELLRAEKDRPEQTAGIKTGWDSIDKLIKTGFCPGELIVLSAPPKIGKSSLALQICAHNAIQETPALFYSLEMRPMKVIEKIVKLHCEKESIGPDEIELAGTAYGAKPLYLGYCYQKPTLDGIVETIKAAVRRYGLRVVVFDHLHFLCRSITNQTQEVGLAVQAFKFLAEEMEIPVILIAQPRKVNPDSIMTAQDLKDSSSIYSDCDHLLLMHRKRKTGSADSLQDMAFDPVTLIRVEASRYNAGGETLLYYHGEYSRFDEMTNRF
jgi:replicative DNA helicase